MSRPSHGYHDPRFEPVVDAFDKSLDAGPFGGASLAVYQDGELVVDVWGGIADVTAGRPWSRDTMTLAYSCTKSIATIVVLHLVDQGRIDLDTTVGTYWPEFDANGKQDVTVRQVLAHRAGVPVVDAPLTFDDVVDGEPVLRALEDQKPLWQPGTAHGYHAITLGTILGEVVRRATGSTMGAILRRELSEPLGLDLWIGLPEAEHSRVATVLPADPRDVPDQLREQLAVMLTDDTAIRAVTLNGAVPIPLVGVSMESAWNNARLWAAEVPAGNGIGTARSFAKLHAALVSEVDSGAGEPRGPLLRPDTLQDARRALSSGPQITGPQLPAPHTVWGTGFMTASQAHPLLGASSFGHDGAAGGLCFADADARVGFAYLPSQFGSLPDQRSSDIVAALVESLG
ncbi:serine hydrolase domain-containing protein [Promicromonospora sp. NPDC052451]|uniref:serine hydrolase domain-containing protein n=1 Tax=Promicromonospora sp. NPDC052451 TaxID=3364407 RepID=UPI0037CC16BC